MGLGSILILLVLLISVIAFIYFVVVTARGWGVLHTLLLCTLFIECWVFIVFAAGVHSTRVKFTKEAAKNQEMAEAAELRTRQLLYGNFDGNSLNREAVVPVKGELRRLTSDRGRVWRGVNFVQAAGEGFNLELSAADVAVDEFAEDPAAAGVSPTSESLPVDLVVYAFAEQLNEAEQPIPVFYLGEHKVKSSQDGAVTLEPTLALTPAQQNYISTGAASSWTLYELLPLDSHRAFAAEGSTSSEEELWGRMDEEEIATLLSGAPEEVRQRLIDDYVRDGKRARDDDPTESIWYEINILKPYDIDVDSDQTANVTERGYFDTSGRAIDGRLKRDGEGQNGRVELNTDAKGIVLKEEAARPLIENGTAELVQRIYVRPLNDYENAFNDFSKRLNDVMERIDLFKRDTATLATANQLGQEMISQAQVEGQKLNSDLQGWSREVAVLRDAVVSAENELGQLKSSVSQMFQSIQSRGGY